MEVSSSKSQALFQRLGDDGGIAQALQTRQHNLQQLARLQLGFQSTGRSQGQKFVRDVRDGRIELAPAFSVATPSTAQENLEPFVSHTYGISDHLAQAQAEQRKPNVWPLLLSARPSAQRAGRALYAVHQNTTLRTRSEQKLQAGILLNGNPDGVLTLRRRGVSPAAQAQVGTVPMISLAQAHHNSLPSPRGPDAPQTIDQALKFMLGEITTKMFDIASRQSGGPEFDPTLMVPDVSMDFSAQGFSVGSATSSAPRNFDAAPNNANNLPTETPTNERALDMDAALLNQMLQKYAQTIEAYNKMFTAYSQSANQAVRNIS